MARLIVYVSLGAIVGFFFLGIMGFGGLAFLEGGILGIVLGGVLGAILGYFLNRMSRNGEVAQQTPSVPASYPLAPAVISQKPYAQKWVVYLFKTIGVLILVITVFATVFPLSTLILLGEFDSLFWMSALTFIALAAILLTLWFGSWYIKKWFLPLLSVLLVKNLVQLVLSIYKNQGSYSYSILYLVIGALVLFIAYRHRDNFSGSYVSYPIWGVFVAAYLIMLFASFNAAGFLTNLVNSDATSTLTSIPIPTSTQEIPLIISSWKTCSNKEFGLTITYPATWKFWNPGGPESAPSALNECQRGPLPWFTLAPSQSQNNNDPFILITPDSASGNIYKNLDQFLVQTDIQSNVKRTTYVNGLTLAWINNGDGWQIFTFHGGKIYHLQFQNINEQDINKFMGGFKIGS